MGVVLFRAWDLFCLRRSFKSALNMIFESASEDEDDEDDSSPDESTGTFFGEGDLLLLTREDDLDSLRLVFDDRCFNGDRVCSVLFPDDFCLTGERLVDDFLLLRSADDELERFRRFEDLWATGERRLLIQIIRFLFNPFRKICQFFI